jgi:hypothetical protein
MAKAKRFQSTSGGPITVSVPGKGWIELSDEPYETDDPAVIEALQANPDAQVVKGKAKNE